jgi:hypothetical protein
MLGNSYYKTVCNGKNDSMAHYMGWLCFVKEDTGKSYNACLVAVENDNEIWFEARNGSRWMVRREQIRVFRPLQPLEEVV